IRRSPDRRNRAADDHPDPPVSDRSASPVASVLARRVERGVELQGRPDGPPGRVIGATRAAAAGRADGARSRVRHVRAAVARRVDRRRPHARVLLLGSVPRSLSRANRLTLMTPESQLRADIVEVGRRMYARGYTASNDGNISVRLGSDRLLMTPKSVCKGF